MPHWTWRTASLVALVGPNGAGKSTLLGVLAGDRTPSSGAVAFDSRDVREWSPGDLARRRAVLAQDNQVAFPFRVREVVEMGRAPWQGRAEQDDDDAAVDEALATCDVAHLADRTFTSLSGGERARVSLARVLAQRTSAVLLDEPTAALDLRHQEDVLRVARSLARAGTAVAVVLHDLSLAAAYADRIAVMQRGSVAAVGSPADVVTPALIEDVYGVAVHVLPGPDGTPLVVPRR
ncbi:heme ABC transporter ATP-binding protein [Demequina litorisediminis]|uniref:Hemin import ATP-binding protein HmuV n=1 Tax=Demequina litorisediminis TaxID=1849022 RepID=A0ABQ6IG42_9MICO|nr:heme ABC transporter ATP-binding protein [Demequina litorisediminis]GMA36882.1 hemin import ATP-binding protein HmuV [Demequina litorisediminis]